MPTVFKVIIWISALSALLPIIAGYKECRLLWFYALLSLVSDIVGIICISKHQPVYLIANTFFLVEWLLLSRYFTQSSFSPFWQHRATIFSAFLGLTYILHTISYYPNDTNLQATAVFYMLYVIGALIAFYRVIQNIQFLQIERSPLFAASAGILLYSSASPIMLLVKRFLDTDDKWLSIHVWEVHNILNVIKNLAIAYSLVLSKKQPIE